VIYTSYEMVRDCRADLPEGWSFFIVNFVPLIRKLLAHYGPDDSASLERALLALRDPQSSLFQSLEPAPERWFIAELRQKVLAQIPDRPTEIALDLETVADALAPLTMVEKQVAWIETMRYSAAETGAMLRIAPATAEKIRDRARDLVRQKVDTWTRNLLAQNGAELGRAAAAATGKDCLNVKTFLDILDGRTTWPGRGELERHVNGCWHCIDHFCRMTEVVELLRQTQPLSTEDAEPYRKLLGIQAPKKRHWWGKT
jgi:hypothetical protein